MRVRYKCPVKGQIRLQDAFVIRAEGISYDFETGPDGELLYIGATVEVSDRKMWPVLTKDPKVGVALHIDMQSPYFDLVRKNLRSAEGMLALFGLEAIDTENSEEIWIPDSEQEREELQLFEFKRTIQKLAPNEWPFTSFDIVGRAILAAPEAHGVEVALSFFRKGHQDMVEQRYLEAAMDFLFMIETMFAEGKIKSAHVLLQYLQNDSLQTAIVRTLTNERFLDSVRRDPRIFAHYAQEYKNKTSSEITERLIGLRGFIHHHSPRKKDSWHPDEHIRFGADAYFLGSLCFELGFSAMKNFLFSEENKLKFIELWKENRSS